jgi:hypothetical protein
MNRLLTTLVQIAIAIPAIFMARIVLREFIQEWKEVMR